MIHNDERWMRQEQQIVNGRWDSELLKLVLLNTMLNELLCSVLCNGHTYHNQYIALTLGPSLSTLSASSYQILPPILFFFFFSQLLHSNLTTTEKMQQLRVGIFCFRHHKQDATFPGSTQLIIFMIMSPYIFTNPSYFNHPGFMKCLDSNESMLINWVRSLF